ncbi:TPA: hypothetical protein N0F65_008596 [Lagenidium giganteum]|uniref:DUF4145 domain-containing protein n=1 Tax=Lagenidium giganteum TaxID=4803 RepID=A0AAV2Z2R4_9STRA|nr:TPA: hypothetical protein N0F65_008596 [Lagenidium giganteum]
MGAATSTPTYAHSNNDYQLAIEASKEIEYFLQEHFGAEGKGLHEKVSSVESELPYTTIKAIRFVASVRNDLIHNRDVKAIKERALFILKFESAMEELQVVAEKKKRETEGIEAPTESGCTIS